MNDVKLPILKPGELIKALEKRGLLRKILRDVDISIEELKKLL
jgi:predicted RNA binding protein YcfA (HicA-like mRNA interferase family)